MVEAPSPGVKRPRREARNSPISSAEATNLFPARFRFHEVVLNSLNTGTTWPLPSSFSEEKQGLKKRNDMTEDNFVTNTLEDELIHNNIRRYGHIFRMNREKITKKSMSMELKGKHQRGRPRSGWEQQIRKYVTWKIRKKGLWEETDSCRGFVARRPISSEDV
jgi:hypothetical protein